MSGHSKWSTIKYKKAAADAKRGQIFSKMAKEIAIVAREGADPDLNIKLQVLIDKAKSQNMPKSNIDRAIIRGAGLDKDAADLEEIMYEGYGPHGVALIIAVITDNRNRSVADIRYWLSKLGGSLGETGCVAWQFEHKGYLALEPGDLDPYVVLELAVESGADDVIFGDDGIEVYAPLENFHAMRSAFERQGFEIESAELTMVPRTTISLEEKPTFQNMRLITALEDLEDVQQVYHNLHIPDDLITEFEAQI
jgi:YebC/PmpR family DNA-binding regulatory protein